MKNIKSGKELHEKIVRILEQQRPQSKSALWWNLLFPNAHAIAIVVYLIIAALVVGLVWKFWGANARNYNDKLNALENACREHNENQQFEGSPTDKAYRALIKDAGDLEKFSGAFKDKLASVKAGSFSCEEMTPALSKVMSYTACNRIISIHTCVENYKKSSPDKSSDLSSGAGTPATH